MRVRFVHLEQEIDVQAAMPAPKKVSELSAWFKSARKAIPQIPDIIPPSKWVLGKSVATLNQVSFELINGTDFCHVVINRQASSLSS